MGQPKISEQVSDIYQFTREYVQLQLDHFRLTAVEKSSRVAALLVTFFIVFLFTGFFILLFSVAVALYVGSLYDAYHWAFLGLSLFYLLLAILFVVFHNKLITNPLVNKLIKIAFRQKENHEQQQ